MNVYKESSHVSRMLLSQQPGEADTGSIIIPVLWRGKLSLTKIKEAQGHWIITPLGAIGHFVPVSGGWLHSGVLGTIKTELGPESILGGWVQSGVPDITKVKQRPNLPQERGTGICGDPRSLSQSIQGWSGHCGKLLPQSSLLPHKPLPLTDVRTPAPATLGRLTQQKTQATQETFMACARPGPR